jgi:hypothetical protein
MSAAALLKPDGSVSPYVGRPEVAAFRAHDIGMSLTGIIAQGGACRKDRSRFAGPFFAFRKPRHDSSIFSINDILFFDSICN